MGNQECTQVFIGKAERQHLVGKCVPKKKIDHRCLELIYLAENRNRDISCEHSQSKKKVRNLLTS